MRALSRQNKIYVVRYYDKYGVVHNCSYSILENARIRLEVERSTGRSAILKCKRGMVIPHEGVR